MLLKCQQAVPWPMGLLMAALLGHGHGHLSTSGQGKRRPGPRLPPAHAASERLPSAICHLPPAMHAPFAFGLTPVPRNNAARPHLTRVSPSPAPATGHQQPQSRPRASINSVLVPLSLELAQEAVQHARCNGWQSLSSTHACIAASKMWRAFASPP